MTASKAMLILFLVLLIALVVVSWGLYGGSPNLSGEDLANDPPKWLSSLNDLFPEPDPTRAKELTGPCLEGGGKSRYAQVAQGKKCELSVGKRDGTRVRHMKAALTKGDSVELTLTPKGDLPGSPKTFKLPKTMKVEGETKQAKDIDLRIAEDGVAVAVRCLSGPCRVTFSGLIP